jgi:cell division protein ZipA
MKDLQVVFSVLGAIAIVAVLVHGFWSIRKQQPKPIKERSKAKGYNEPAQRRDQQGFDADGIGAVRVRKPGSESVRLGKGETSVPVMTLQKKSANARSAMNTEPSMHCEQHRHEPDHEHRQGFSHEQGRHAGHQDVEQIIKPEQRAVFTEQAAGISVGVKPSAEIYSQSQPEQPRYSNASSAPMSSAARVDDKPVQEPEVVLGEPQDVLVLHVVAKEGEQIQGAELLPCLLSLNFKFGDMDIFHRHLDNAGNGKVLFSMANMLKPGVFDPDNMEQFSTEGVVLFMTLPCYGDAVMNFSTMLNLAEQLADDLDAVVLDERRTPWTEHNKHDYLRRIKAII